LKKFVDQALVKEAGVQGRKCTPKTFDLVKIWATLLIIRAKSMEIWSKCVNTFAKSLHVL